MGERNKLAWIYWRWTGKNSGGHISQHVRISGDWWGVEEKQQIWLSNKLLAARTMDTAFNCKTIIFLRKSCLWLQVMICSFTLFFIWHYESVTLKIIILRGFFALIPNQTFLNLETLWLKEQLLNIQKLSEYFEN